ncbi:RICIN domain-containing protein [Kitasatospora sp. NBC_00374]|uniref:RICIN domain-containing protein n=1 Tax=Kitasatospora sp. NBC_00374 TaxID=2975964 RepID=UPI003243207A
MPLTHGQRRPRPHRHRTGLAATVVASAALVAGSLTAVPAAAAESGAPQVIVRLDPSYQQQPFQGWGTALAWFANVTGGWPDAQRNRLADELYGANGLGFTIARYNIGGGDSPETRPYMRPGAAVPGYWNRPAAFGPPADGTGDRQEPVNWWNPADPTHWNDSADPNQRWWLQAARKRGADTFEAFSNSAPYFMTHSSLASGAALGWQDNLRADQYGRFAAYLAGALKRVEASTGVDFASISPVNEPNTDYWRAGGPQEGSHWDPASQAQMITSLRTALNAAGDSTPIAAMDETNPTLFREDWDSYPAPVRRRIGRLNTHTYSTGGRPAVRDIAKGSGTPLWMSEVDLGGTGGQSFTAMSPALDLARRINGDIRELEPRAWVMWQAVEDYENMTADHENANWGLIQVDLTPADPATEPIRRNKKYWAMANYSRFVRPGARVIATNADSTLAALRPNGGAVVVHTNSTGAAEELTLDLGGFTGVNTAVPVQRYTTDAARNLQRDADLGTSAAKTLTTTVGPDSVTTFVIPGATGIDDATATAPTGTARQLVNDNSGLALAAAGHGLVQHPSNAADPAQRWTFTRISGGWNSTASYRITDGADGTALAVDGTGALALAAPATSSAQYWLLSTTGDGHSTLVNKATGRLLDVSGAATWDGAAAGAFQPTGERNQSWRLRSTAPDTWGPLRPRHSGTCVAAAGGATSPGAPAVQEACTGGAGQQWTLRSSSPGYVNIVARHGGMCLAVAGGSTADGAAVVQYGCDEAADQEFSVRAQAAGHVVLVARHSGRCLDVAGASSAAGAALVQYACNRSTSQQFRTG